MHTSLLPTEPLSGSHISKNPSKGLQQQMSNIVGDDENPPVVALHKDNKKHNANKQKNNLESIIDIDEAVRDALMRVSSKRQLLSRQISDDVHQSFREKLASLTIKRKRAKLLGFVGDEEVIVAAVDIKQRPPLETAEPKFPSFRRVSLLGSDAFVPKEPRMKSRGSVNLGSQRFMAKMRAVTPKNFNVMKQNKVVLGVSLGSKNTELVRLDAVLQWITSNFDECTIMTGDYIYRLTLALKHGLDDEEAEEAAIDANAEYKAMCTTVLAQYQGMCKFNWRPMSDVVKKYPTQFEQRYADMKDLYLNDRQFRISAKQFSETYTTRVDREDAPDAAVVSLRYLLEEYAIFSCLCEEEPTTLIYAGSIKNISEIIDGNFDAPTALINIFKVVELDVVGKGKYFPTGDRKVVTTGGYMVGAVERPVHSTNLLANLEEETHYTLVRSMKTRSVRSGVTLLTVGDIPEELWVIKGGRAEEVLKRPDGSFQRLSFLTEGSVVGLEGFLDGKPSPVTIDATEDCSLLRITRRNYESLIDANPKLERNLLLVMARVESHRARSLMFELQNVPR
jgi:tRNA-dependent cyclodipeptide synthase